MVAHVPDLIRTLALYTVADLIKNHQQNQESFSNCIITRSAAHPEQSGMPNQKLPPGIPTPSIKAIINTALEKGRFPLRYAACYVFYVF